MTKNESNFASYLNSYKQIVMSGIFEEIEPQAAALNMVERCQSLFNKHPQDSFNRNCVDDGHFTGSALVVDTIKGFTLLHHHKKLGRWLNLGGHADGNSKLDDVAWQETTEESGTTPESFVPWDNTIDSLASLSPNVPIAFDLDIHEIPARKNEPVHWHYDFCFLIEMSVDAPISCSEESNDLKWVSLKDARSLCTDSSLIRKLQKFELIRSVL